MRWDPTQYEVYAGPRSRPYFDLVARINAEAPQKVVDLGCGPGDQTATLVDRWPTAEICGIDSSQEMLDRAPADAGVSFSLGDANEFDATGVDVLIANAVLQWVPAHRELLVRWAAQLNPGGWLAFQVPDNFGAPSHVLMRELAETERWRSQLGAVLRGTDSVARPADYLDRLIGAGLNTDVWQTEYLHLLDGDDPVLEWVRGTGLRPVLEILDEDDTAAFSAEYKALLRAAYPRGENGTVFPFRRTFVVAERAADGGNGASH